MPRFKVEFTHLTENKYEGYIEADSLEQALELAEAEPFDLDELELMEEQGIECKDFELEEH